MGQKVNPNGIRLGINKTWKSRWYVDQRQYADTILEDLKLRRILRGSPETQGADVGDVEIIRQPQRITMVVHTSRPGVIIGAKGSTIEKIGAKLQQACGKKIQIKIKEVKRPEVDAQIIALNVAKQLKGRSSFRRTIKMAISNAMKAGTKGVKIKISGRLGGAEMARTVAAHDGSIPLHTLRANIDYGFAEADTTYGIIGVKVWINRGESYGNEKKDDAGLLVKKKGSQSRRRKNA